MFSLRLILHGRRVCVARAPAVRRLRAARLLPVLAGLTGNRGQHDEPRGNARLWTRCETGCRSSGAVSTRFPPPGSLATPGSAAWRRRDDGPFGGRRRIFGREFTAGPVTRRATRRLHERALGVVERCDRVVAALRSASYSVGDDVVAARGRRRRSLRRAELGRSSVDERWSTSDECSPRSSAASRRTASAGAAGRYRRRRCSPGSTCAACPATDCAAALPRPVDGRRRRRWPRCATILADVRDAGRRRACASSPSVRRRRARRPARCPAADAARRARRASTPTLRDALERGRRRHRATSTATQLRPTEPLRARRHRRADAAPCRSTGPAATCPGGRAVYPSTVLMTAVPARVAGVPEVVLCVPPDRATGAVPDVDARRGRDRRGRRGVPRSAARRRSRAMAYGTESIRPVDVIVGPGQRLRRASPSARSRARAASACRRRSPGRPRSSSIADDTRRAELAAIDVIVQAEHGPTAWPG